jgi:hypothetical protein
MPLPEEELQDKPVKSDRTGYFKVILTGLKPGTTYPLQFRWAYKDKTFSKWSAKKELITPNEELPGDPKFEPGDVVAVPGGMIIKWDGQVGTGVDVDPIQFDRVDVHISGTSYGDGTKAAGSFKGTFKHLFKAEPGIYIVQIKVYYKSGVSSFFSEAYTVTVPPQEEEVQTPVTPKGFSSERVLSGIEVAWDGTYTGGAEWYGFQAINIYAGTSSTATSGTYIKVGQMTANKTGNKIVAPVDGTYIRYDQPVYFHASSLNKKGEESAVVSNVTSQATGARSAIPSDLSDNIITNAKLVDDAVTAAKIATAAITEVKIDNNAITAAKIAAGAITEVKIDNAAITAAKIAANAVTSTAIADDAITTPKLTANAITADKITASAITSDKIAANAIDADKIAANAITAAKLAAGSVEAGKIAAGAITADKIAANAIESDKIAANAITSAKIVANAITADKIVSSAITADKIATNAITASKIQAGEIDVTKLSAGTISVNNLEAGSLKTTTYIRAGAAGGGRIDMSASALSGIPAGLYIYNSGGSPVFEAPLGGGVTITGSLKATEISTNSGKFSVNTSGVLIATGADIGGTIKADGGNIGGIAIAADAIQNGANAAGSTFRLDNTGKARFGTSNGNSIILNPSASTGGATEAAKSYIYHSTDGGSTSAGVFRVQADGKLFATSAEFTGQIKSGSSITGTTINGSVINGGSINISNTSFTPDDGDSDSGAGSSFNTSQSNAFYSSYERAPFGGYGAVTCVGFNGIGLISTATAGVVSSWYPYYDGAADLGVKYSPTYLTNPYRWRHLRLTGSVMVGGDGSSDTPVAAPATNGPRTRLYSDGGIYANSLNQGSGTTTGSTVVQNSSGFLKVSTSSRRFKENIIEISKSGYLDATYQLSPVSFNYINENEEEPTISGLIAEDVDLIPEFKGIVNYDADGLPLSVAYDRMSALLVLAIKEIKDRLENIEQRLDAIEG